MKALLIALCVCVYLAIALPVARWNWGHFRARGIDYYAKRGSEDPVEDWWERKYNRPTHLDAGAGVGTLLAILCLPLYVLTFGFGIFINRTGQKSQWEKEQDLKAARKQLEELEKENERWRKVVGA